jgi:hypothetical protein
MVPSTSCGTTSFSQGTTSDGACGDQQRASTVGQVFMRGEERLDPARTGHAEAVDVDPPTPAARYSKREVGQGLDASLAQHCGDAGLEPEVDAVADQGNGNGALRSCSMAAAMARAAAGPLRAGPVKSLARSSRWRDLAKAAMSRRIAPMTPRDD